jgi:hypothetical protein
LNKDAQHIANDDLLVNYLADEARADERAAVEQWIAANESNRLHFEQFKLLWDAGQQLALTSAVDEDGAWDRFRARIERKDTDSHKRRFHFSFLKAAAVMLVVAAAAMVGTRLIRHRDTPNNPAPAKKHPAGPKNDTILNNDTTLQNDTILNNATSPKSDTMLKKKPDTVSLTNRQPEKNTLKKETAIKPNANKRDDLLLQPDTLQKIAREPGNWPLYLERYTSPAENLAIRRAIIGHLRDEMTTQQVAGHEPITSFMLNENEFFVNEKRQPDSIHQWYKERFIKAPGFFVYFGGGRRPGQGICLGRDSLP